MNNSLVHWGELKSKIKIPINLLNNNSIDNLRFVNLTIYNNMFYGVVDSGSKCCVIDYDIIKKLNINIYNDEKYNLVGVNGDIVNYIGCCELNIIIENMDFHIKFFVLKSFKYGILLGNNFLKLANAIINFKSETLTLENDSNPLSQIEVPLVKPNNNIYLRASKTFNILPGNFMLISCFCDETLNMNKNYLIENFNNKVSILNAYTKPNTTNTIDVLILNNLTEPLMIYKYTKLAIATDDINDDSIEICYVNIDDVLNVFKSNKEINLLNIDANAIDNADVSTVKLNIQGMTFEINSNLTEEQKDKLINVLKNNLDAFAKNDNDLGRCSLIKHTIDTGDHKPIRQNAYRASPEQRKIINNLIAKMLQAGIIRPSRSEWTSPVFVVPKKNW